MTRPATGPLTENVPVLISLIFGFLDTDINVPGENIALINYDITANFVLTFQTILTAGSDDHIAGIISSPPSIA